MQYCFDCGSSHDCFGCCHLNNKEFCIFNVQYTEEEYAAKLAELKKQSPEEILKQVGELRKKFPKIQSNFRDNTNSDYVDYVYKSQNAYYCFDSNSLEDCGYLSNTNDCKDSWDCNQANKLEHCAECVDSFECYNCYGAEKSDRCYDSMFIYNCEDSSNLFMCSNLSNAKHCILNVQYTPEEYAAKVAELKNQLGLGFTN
jgi:ribosomal protein L29